MFLLTCFVKEEKHPMKTVGKKSTLVSKKKKLILLHHLISSNAHIPFYRSTFFSSSFGVSPTQLNSYILY